MLCIKQKSPPVVSSPFRFLKQVTWSPRNTVPRSARHFSKFTCTMADLSVELTAPNGRKYKQPLGLFINNEFVPSKSGQKLTTINPRSLARRGLHHLNKPSSDKHIATSRKLPPCLLPGQMMWMSLSKRPARH